MRSYITWFEIAALVACLWALPVIWKKPFLRFFPFVLVAIVFTELYETYFRPAGQPNNALSYNLMVPLQQLMYLGALYFSLYNNRRQLLILLLGAGLLVSTLASLPYYINAGKFNVIAYTAGAVGMVVGILLVFYEMLKSPEDFNFLRRPYFYMLFMLLLFTVGTLPYFAMGNWLYYQMGRPEMVMVLGNVMSILNCLLYSTYTFCFIWMKVAKVY